MRASDIVKSLNSCINLYGDKDLFYLSIKRGESDTVFIEEITTVKITFVKENGKNIIAPYEPILLCGNRGNKFFSEKFISLNWFGRLIKKIIFSKHATYITKDTPLDFTNDRPFVYRGK